MLGMLVGALCELVGYEKKIHEKEYGYYGDVSSKHNKWHHNKKCNNTVSNRANDNI